MGGFGLFQDTEDAEIKQSSQFLPEQDAFLRAIIEQLSSNFAGGTGAYPGQLAADTPFQFSQGVENFASNVEQFQGEDFQGAFAEQLSGQPAFGGNAESIAKYWQDALAKPATSVFTEQVIPELKEGLDIFSTRTPQVIGRRYDEFMSNVLLPPLFQAQMADRQLQVQSAEKGKDRQAGAVSLATQLPMMMFVQDMAVSNAIVAENQRKLTAAYQDYLTTQTWGMQAAGIGGPGRFDTIVQEPGETWEDKYIAFASMAVAAAGGGGRGRGGGGA